MSQANGQPIRVLCAGAAQGLINALKEKSLIASEVQLDCRFGAVGAMREALLAGEPCDVMIVTSSMIQELLQAGHLRRGSESALGNVSTGIAVPSGDPWPDISTADALKMALLAASGIYFPDPQRATAGIHFASVLSRIGIAEIVGSRLRTFPNGATAMRELAAGSEASAIGCTQVTEIITAPGVDCVGILPEGCGLSTTYSAAVACKAHQPESAQAFVRLVAGPATEALRRTLGFDGT